MYSLLFQRDFRYHKGTKNTQKFAFLLPQRLNKQLKHDFRYFKDSKTKSRVPQKLKKHLNLTKLFSAEKHWPESFRFSDEVKSGRGDNPQSAFNIYLRGDLGLSRGHKFEKYFKKFVDLLFRSIKLLFRASQSK